VGNERFIAKAAGAFNKARALVFDTGTEVEFLKASDTADEFDIVDTVTEKWWLEYSNFRRNFLLEVAEDATILQGTMAEATHIRIADEIYVINRRDMTPPQGTDVTWKIYCDRYTKRSNFQTLY
jgi:hypothetical protein